MKLNQTKPNQTKLILKTTEAKIYKRIFIYKNI